MSPSMLYACLSIKVERRPPRQPLKAPLPKPLEPLRLKLCLGNISKSKSILPNISARSGLVGNNPPGPIWDHPRPFFHGLKNVGQHESAVCMTIKSTWTISEWRPSRCAAQFCSKDLNRKPHCCYCCSNLNRESKQLSRWSSLTSTQHPLVRPRLLPRTSPTLQRSTKVFFIVLFAMLQTRYMRTHTSR